MFLPFVSNSPWVRDRAENVKRGLIFRKSHTHSHNGENNFTKKCLTILLLTRNSFSGGWDVLFFFFFFASAFDTPAFKGNACEYSTRGEKKEMNQIFCYVSETGKTKANLKKAFLFFLSNFNWKS
jgi:hypothetical protein